MKEVCTGHAFVTLRCAGRPATSALCVSSCSQAVNKRERQHARMCIQLPITVAANSCLQLIKSQHARNFKHFSRRMFECQLVNASYASQHSKHCKPENLVMFLVQLLPYHSCILWTIAQLPIGIMGSLPAPAIASCCQQHKLSVHLLLMLRLYSKTQLQQHWGTALLRNDHVGQTECHCLPAITSTYRLCRSEKGMLLRQIALLLSGSIASTPESLQCAAVIYILSHESVLTSVKPMFRLAFWGVNQLNRKRHVQVVLIINIHTSQADRSSSAYLQAELHLYQHEIHPYQDPLQA